METFQETASLGPKNTYPKPLMVQGPCLFWSIFGGFITDKLTNPLQKGLSTSLFWLLCPRHSGSHTKGGRHDNETAMAAIFSCCSVIFMPATLRGYAQRIGKTIFDRRVAPPMLFCRFSMFLCIFDWLVRPPPSPHPPGCK